MSEGAAPIPEWPYYPTQERTTFWGRSDMTQNNQPPPAVPGWTPPPLQSPKKPLWRRPWFVILAAIVVIGILGSAFNPGQQSPTAAVPAASLPASPSGQATSASPTEEASDEPEEEESPEPEETEPAEPEMTVSQENAVEKAEQYLEFSAFSRKGLIKQLKYEGFSTKDATFAVDHITVSWKEQAVRKARDYLDYSSFSRKSLIRQLRFEGFSASEAKYGAKKVGL